MATDKIMVMRTQSFFAFLVLLIISMASACRESSSSPAYTSYEEMESAYRTNTLREVERMLHTYLVRIGEGPADAASGIDIDMLRADAHQRLFLIYRKTGETNNMNAHFAKAMEYLNKFNRRVNLPVVTNSLDSLAAALEKAEAGIAVRWRTE